MTGKQSAVLWMGLLLIAAQFYFGGQWKALFGQIKGPSSKLSFDPNAVSNAALNAFGSQARNPHTHNSRAGGARHGK